MKFKNPVISNACVMEIHWLKAVEDLWDMMQNMQVKGNTKILKQQIYFFLQGTTLILWFPLILMSVVEVVFSCRCFLACTSFLRLRCPWRRNVRVNRTTCSDCTVYFFIYFFKGYTFSCYAS